MHASCGICGDIFTGIDAEVLHSTPCGHIYHYTCLLEWLERSNTCPHCRARVDRKNTIKLYFQISNLPAEDSGSLQNEVQSLKFKLSLNEMDLKRAVTEANEAKVAAKGLRIRLIEKEEEGRSHLTVVSNLQEQVKILKSQLKGLKEAQLEVDMLRNKLTEYENLETILKGSASDAADALAIMKDSDPSILCACISALKKELNQYKSKSKVLQNILSVNESKLKSTTAEISKFEKRISILNRSLSKLKEDLLCTEKENESLKKKCKHLEDAIIPTQSESNSKNPRDTALKRFINEFPSPSLKKISTSTIDVDVTLPNTNDKMEAEISVVSPIRRHQEMKHRSLLTNKRISSIKSTSTSDVQCYDGLGGHLPEPIPLTDRSVLSAMLKNKTNKTARTTKRLKTSGTLLGKQQTNLSNFIKKM